MLELVKNILNLFNPKTWIKYSGRAISTSVENTADNFQEIKKIVVYRSFWGRSSLYKNVLHISFLFFSILIFITGISTRLSTVEINSKALNLDNNLNPGDIDLLQQGGSIETILASTPGVYFKVNEYKVENGDSLQSIADKFKVTKDTIKWANTGKIDYYSEKVNVGDTLQIPEVPGVLYQVKDGDTLDSVISKTSGDRATVIDVNQLDSPEYKLAVGSNLLIPDGKLPPPPPAIPQPSYYRSPTNYGQSLVSGTGTIAGIITSDPLSNPDCAGYVFIRGFSPWHNGVDLSKYGGCPIRAIADGTVIYAGWGTYGEGYNVKIDHGNGIQSMYYHGDGNIWVKPGDHVARGQDIMYMGCTGNCTGTHLHLGLRINGVVSDPAPYVPY